jgi:hypothetical protein
MTARLILLALLCAAPMAQADIYTVTSSADSGPGSLRDQIALVNLTPGSAHRIEFAPALAQHIIELLQPLPAINKPSVVIDASAAPGISVEPINPTASFRLLIASSQVQSLTLRGFSLRSGRAENTGEGGGCVDGGAVPNTATLLLEQMSMVSCGAVQAGITRGGAVYWNGSIVTAIDSVFFGNFSLTTGTGNFAVATGGAIYGAALNLQNSRFEQNQTGGNRAVGGAVSAYSSVLMSDSVFVENLARGVVAGGSFGGALSADCFGSCTIRIDRSFFGRNESQTGGAMFLRTNENQVSDATFNNLSFEGNVGTGAFSTDVGAVQLQAIRLTARHLSFQGNSGVVAHLSGVQNCDLREIHNSVFGARTGSGISCFLVAFAQPAQGTIVADSSCGNLIPGASVVPGLVNGEVNIADRMPVIRYASSSPVVDAGATALCLADDARGTSRPQDGNGDGQPVCDIGAHELLPARIFADGFED